LGHVKNILNSSEHFGEVEEALFDQKLDVSVVKATDFFKVSGLLETLLKLDLKRLEHVDLEIAVDVVN